ncbi:MAG: ZIP family metal transporter [Gammaproteobacteria bacterium]|nr:ZIP family metal transporter [Gammaproteobacteria bacterium]
MSVLAWVLLFSFLAGALSMAGALVYTMLPQRTHVASVRHLVSFATGALLSAAFVGLLPEALEARPDVGASAVMATVLFGVITFFLLEKTLIWRHAHHDDAEAHGADPHHVHIHGRNAAYMIMVGDTFHNALDGVLIAAAFTTDIKLGIITSVAIIAHEIPQELGDLVIMLEGGISKAKALLLNAVSSLATVAGALLALIASDFVKTSLPYLLAFTASSFIYVAVADLIPSLQRHTKVKDSLLQVVLIVLGMALVIYLDHRGH